MNPKADFPWVEIVEVVRLFQRIKSCPYSLVNHMVWPPLCKLSEGFLQCSYTARLRLPYFRHWSLSESAESIPTITHIRPCIMLWTTSMDLPLLPEKCFPHTAYVCRAVRAIWDKLEYMLLDMPSQMRNAIHFRYLHNNVLNTFFYDINYNTGIAWT